MVSNVNVQANTGYELVYCEMQVVCEEDTFMKRRFTYGLVLALGLVLGGILQPFNGLGALAQQGNCQTFKETGHTLCGKFLTYWQQHGSLAQQGFPISEPFNEKSDLNGQSYLVQYFERAVFEMHPENPAPNDVLLSQLGTFQARSKYGNPPKFPGAPEPTPVPPPGLGDKIIIQEGVTITLVQESGIIGDCGPRMNWVLLIENTSKLAYTFRLDVPSISETDSTGKVYQLFYSCNYAMTHSSDHIFSPGEHASIFFSFDVADMPSSVSYLELKFKANTLPLTFRFPLK